jgi:protein tyrosine/serine phosphatase
LILRSREPSPGDILRLEERYGLKTVISLNGDLDKKAWLFARGKEPRQVNLRRFIAERGLRHEVFHMSASRAPSDEELRGVFRLLRDDSLKPALVHCRGGSDRTGVIGALYGIEFLGQTKEEAKATMRQHMWAADGGTEIQGAVVDLYQPGTIRRLLGAPARRWF